MEYQVPQFTDVENKIFGPFSFRQFIYLAGGAGLSALLFAALPFIFAIILSIPVAGLAGTLAFYRLNNKPFLDIVEAAMHYFLSKRLYLWRKEDKVATGEPLRADSAAISKKRTSPIEKLTRGKLRDLAWSLDVRDTKD